MSLELQSLLPYPNSCVGASPHQQGRDTKMLSFCGIDVSKDRLDVMVLPEEQCCSVPNDASGWAALVERHRGSSGLDCTIRGCRRSPPARTFRRLADCNCKERRRPYSCPRTTAFEWLG